MKIRSTPIAATLLILLSAQLPSRLNAQDFSLTQTKPSPLVPLIQQANDALAASNFTLALKLLNSLDAQSPNNPQVLYDLGLTLEGLAPAAPDPSLTPESCYRKSIAADPDFPEPHVALGLLLARTNRPDEARTQLHSATAIPAIPLPLKARALRALARLQLDGDKSSPPDPSAASTDLLAALKLSSEEPEDILLSAQIAAAAPDLPSAEKAYRRYLAVEPATDPSIPSATAALAHVLLLEDRPADARTLLANALAQDPDDPSLTAQLAATLLASNDSAQIAQAVPLLVKLHAAHPSDPNITRLLARVYVASGDPAQADLLYAALIAASPHPDPTLLDERADALLRLRRPAEAEALLKRAIADPSAFPTPADLGDAATHLAFAASEIDDPRTTLQALTLRATVLAPSPSSLYLQATANDTLHQSSQAVDLYKQFLAAAAGKFPEQELQVRQRLAELEHRK